MVDADSFSVPDTVPDLDRARAMIKEKNLRPYIHSPCTCNLAHPQYSGLSAKLINKIVALVTPIPVVVHIGKVGSLTDFLKNYDQMVKSNGPILLENMSGAGSEIGTTLSDLRRVFETIDDKQVKLCFDTQHAFSAGLHSFAMSDTSQFMDTLEETVGKGRVGLVHLNDSKTVFSGRKDSHANIGEGHIWNDSSHLTGLAQLLTWCRDKEIDMILETPNPTGCYQLLRLAYR